MGNSTKQDAGFIEQEVWTFTPDKKGTTRVDLLLPNTDEIKKYASNSYRRANELDIQHRRMKEDLIRQLEQEVYGVPVNSSPESDDEDNSDKRTSFISKRDKDEADKDPVAQAKVLQARAAMDTIELEYEEWAPVYAPLEPLKLLDSSRGGSTSDKAQALEVYRTLRDRGHMRKLAQVSVDRANEIFNELVVSHPLFEDVTRFVRDQILLCHRRFMPLHLAPILLAGVPGTGKTHYAKALATAIGASYFEMGFDTDRTSSALLGSSAHWGNSQPGVVYLALAFEANASANPIILLDEICKARASSGHQDPLTSLHGLLEPVSNKKVTDISTVGLTMDASLISWIATANDLSRVLPSILSRFRIFVIMPALDGSTGLKVAAQVVKTTHKSMDLEGFQEPAQDVIRCLASLLVPRMMRVALEMAYGAATSAGRNSLTAKDFEELDPEYVPPKDGATVYH